jgi:antitoxin HicB
MEYQVVLERSDDGAVLVTFPDFPGARATGEYEGDALLAAERVLALALGACIQQRKAIPAPRGTSAPAVSVPLLVEAKVRVYEAMREAGVGRAELARRLRWHRPQVDRLLNVRHQSRFDQLEAALAVLGARFTLSVESQPQAPARARSYA